MKKSSYSISVESSGHVIEDKIENLQVAIAIVKGYIQFDKENGEYIPNFYEIAKVNEKGETIELYDENGNLVKSV